MSDFSFPVRVYYEDTDAGGVVYHANYLRFMERARTEWLRQLGFTQRDLRERQKVLFVVRGVQIDYRRPALFDDELRVDSDVESASRTALRFHQRILRPVDDSLICDAEVGIVCVDADAFRPIAIPDAIRDRIQPAE